MLQMSNRRYKHVLSGPSEVFIYESAFIFSLHSVSVHFRSDYLKFLHLYFSKLNDSISESRYYTSSDS